MPAIKKRNFIRSKENEKIYNKLSKIMSMGPAPSTVSNIDLILETAIKNGFSLNYTKDGKPPLLHIAIRGALKLNPEKGVKLIRSLINHGADVNIATPNDPNALICICRFAACEASLDLFQEVVDRTNDINYRAEMCHFVTDFESKTPPKESAFLALISRYVYPFSFSINNIKEEREGLLQRMTVLLNAGVDPKELDEKTWDKYLDKVCLFREKEDEKTSIKELKDFIADHIERKQQIEAINNDCVFDYEL